MQYGEIITVQDPTGHPVQAQVGEMTPDGPVIHIHAYQIEAPAEALRQEGWKIEQVTSTQGTGTGTYAGEAKQIVQALLSEEVQTTGVRTMALPYYSPLKKTTVKVNAELYGDVAVFRDDNNMWTARNLRTQRVSNAPDKQQAIQDVAY